MPDKKLTDNEIIKALEMCCNTKHCRKCTYAGRREFCIAYRTREIFDLINRLQAENAMLESLNETNGIMIHELNKSFENIKAEAYKEFAEEIENINLSNSDDYFEFKRSRFDNLLNELVGEDNAD